MTRFSLLSPVAVCLVLLGTGAASARADSSCGSVEAKYPNYAFYRDAARFVYDNLTQTTTNLSPQSKQELDSLFAQPGGALSKKSNGASPLLSTQSSYDNDLAAVYAQPFSSSDSIGHSNAGSSQDIYTFCPRGAHVVREGGGTYSHCQLNGSQSTAPTEIRIQGLWVSNDKKPVLTLELTGADYGNGGGKPRIHFDIQDLLSGNVSFNDVFKAMWPSKHSVPPADCTGKDPAESGALVQSLDGSDAVLEKLSGAPANPADPASTANVKPAQQGFPVEAPAPTSAGSSAHSVADPVGK